MTIQKTPIIGIVPNFSDGTHQFGDGVQRIFIRRDYLETISGVGALPLILNPNMLTPQIMELCSGIVIAGGDDIDPIHYGEEPLPEVVNIEPKDRFEWEKEIIQACDEAALPILGICYGMQRLNVHYGGTLLQDIKREYGDQVQHSGAEHEVRFTENFLGISDGTARHVASRHHQAVGRLADGFEVVATAPDGIVEAFRGRNHRYGMQWHPESDTTGAHVYRAFVELCSGAR
ncbi:MAG: type 1 glutamine amidotransferase [Candidatus Saccharimonas sp.]|nr:type 1 glutamine amidotransferase [Candidatus Saccharimonas sp.]